MATTTNLAFELPTVGSDVDAWGGKLNSNWTDIDGYLESLFSSNASSLRPAELGARGIWVDTDTDDYAYYNGASDVPLFNTTSDEVAWYLGGATTNWLTDDGTDTLLYRNSALLGQLNATRATWYTGEMVVEGGGATLRLSDSARDGLANNSVDFDYDGSTFTFRSRDGGDASIEEIYAVDVGTDGRPDTHTWFVDTSSSMTLDNTGLGLTNAFEIAYNNPTLKLRDTTVSTSYNTLGIVWDSSDLVFSTLSSTGTLVAEDYVMTGGATGAVSHEWAIEDTPTFRVQSNTARVLGSAPRVEWYENDAGTDEKLWRAVAAADALTFQVKDDSGSNGEDFWIVDRSGDSVTRQRLKIGGVDVLDVSDTAMFLNTDGDYIETPNQIRPVQIVLADNTSTFVDLNSGNDTFAGCFLISSNNNSAGSALVDARLATSSQRCNILVQTGSFFTATTGTVLSGTTGTDVRCNLSCNASGRLYIENRLGTTVTYRLIFFGG